MHSRPRSGLLRHLVLTLIALLVVHSTLVAPGQAYAANANFSNQAIQAMTQLEHDFYDAHAGLYRATGGQHEPYIALWPTSQVLAAAIAVARSTHAGPDIARVRRIIGSLHIFLSPQGGYHARIIRSLRYTDDDNWIALDLLDAYDLLHDPAYIARAESIFAYLITAWDTKHGGGLLWADGSSDRPTVSTAPAITIAARLAVLTHKSVYRDWARRLYAWENANLGAPNGLFWDHVGMNGAIDKDIVSYNQGVMIDANLAYAKLTGSAAYLTEARHIAAAAAAALSGPRLNRGRYAAFDAIYYQALAHLNAASPKSASLEQARSFVRWFWPIARQPRAPANRTEEDVLEQAGFVSTALVVAATTS
ncbi:MAG TPA: glycoside hydrolase family 76 protein [Chloroflexota bacterium]